jgi:hypothetical protein
MRFDPKALLAGHTMLEIRDLLRWMGHSEFNAEAIGHRIGVSAEQLPTFIAALKDAGLIERGPWARDVTWQSSERGGALAMARATKPIKRARAEQELQSFLDRVKAMRDDPKFLYRCRQVLLFGSMLTDIPEVGDVDVAVELASKAPDNETRVAQDRAYMNAQLAAGRRPRNIVEMHFMAQLDAKAFLKNRSRILSVHTTDDPVLKKTKTKVLVDDP